MEPPPPPPTPPLYRSIFADHELPLLSDFGPRSGAPYTSGHSPPPFTPRWPTTLRPPPSPRPTGAGSTKDMGLDTGCTTRHSPHFLWKHRKPPPPPPTREGGLDGPRTGALTHRMGITPGLQEGGGLRKGSLWWGKFRFSVWCRSSPHEMFLRNLGSFPLLVHPPLVAVAGYCCAVVGSPSSLGSETLVVVENVCELGSSAKQDHIF